MALKGKATFYPGKVQKPVTTNFTDDCRRAIQELEKRTEASRGDIMEHALRKQAGLPLNEELERALQDALPLPVAAPVESAPAAEAQSATAP